MSFIGINLAQNIGQIIEVLWVWKRISLLVKTWKMNNRTFIFINKHGIIQSRKSFSNLSFTCLFLEILKVLKTCKKLKRMFNWSESMQKWVSQNLPTESTLIIILWRKRFHILNNYHKGRKYAAAVLKNSLFSKTSSNGTADL